MKWIGHLCLANMKKRGIRTGLTILGVVIGVISIVSLLALGLGVKQELLSSVEEEGSVTEIIVYGNMEGKWKNKMLTERRFVDIAGIDHIEVVYPCLSVSMFMQYNQFDGYAQVLGVSRNYLADMEIEEGELPKERGSKPELLLGKYAMAGFYNEITDTCYPELEEQEKLTGEKMQVQFADNGENALKDKLDIAGIAKRNTYEIYCDLDLMKKYLKRNQVDGKIAGQPVNADNENYNEWIYNQAIVKVDKVEHVDAVTKQLQDMGFQAESQKEFVDYINQQLKIIQILLGGIGMIALIVAVIGIGNTMTTSVYDRVNEIGVLKVLGCETDELLHMFLLESGILGGLGGLIGIVLSYGIAKLLINQIGVKLMEMPKGTELAVIPAWLAIAAFLSAILLGVLAGFFPAKWAAKLNPMEALRKLT